jgi:hypothetical protein
MHKKSAVTLLAIALVIAGVAGGYSFFTYYHDTGSSACPNIFASVTYQNAKGFSTVAHPDAGTTEYVLPANSTGSLEVVYTSSDSNLTKSMFAGAAPAWLVNTATNVVQPTSNVQVSTTSVENENAHTVVVNYTISSGTVQALYLIGLPSTCHSLLLNVGTSAYTGPLPW